MTFSKRFTGLFALLVLTASSQAFACPGGTTAWIRDSSGKLVETQVTLDNLKNNKFETDHFKVVVGTQSDAVSTDDAKYCSRASHVLYTLEHARSTIASKLGDAAVSWMPQITARLDIDVLFSEVIHFQAESRGQIDNDSLSVPASTDEKLDSVAPWGLEIWFRPAKKEKSESTLQALGDATSKASFRNMVAGNTAEQGLLALAPAAASPSEWSLLDPVGHAIGVGLTLGVLEVAPVLMKGAGKFLPGTDYLDTAMIPEIVDHEYSHTLLSRHIPLSISTPVVEGYANYFAGVISGMAKLADHAGKFSKDAGKDGLDKEKYQSLDETDAYAEGNFVFAVLWKIRLKLGADLSDKVIFASHFLLDPDADIKNGMTSAIFNAADVVAKTPSEPSALEMHLQLHQVLQDEGL